MKNSILLILNSFLLSITFLADSTAIVLIADPRVLKIPIHENQESLMDLKDQSILVFGPSPEIPNNTDYTKMRKGVYDRLVKAQALLPKGYKFCLYEAYRSLTTQEKIFSDQYKQLKSLHPTWPHEQIFKESTKLVSPVINLDGSKNIPPHSTGGAIDVYLLGLDDQPVDMGIHPKDWMQDLDGKTSQTDSPKISSKAQRHRAIMSKALSAVGFINYPTEYWHWSFGDLYWAYHTKNPTAIYGGL